MGIPGPERLENPGLPLKKLAVVDNPFNRDDEADKLLAVPALNPDVALIHAHLADAEGTVRIEGLAYTDVDQVKASRHVIVSCEELVEPGMLRGDPTRNQIPFFMVDAVVPMPFGAHPTACYGYYDYDPVHLKLYAEKAKHEDSLREYLDTYVHGTIDHADYLSRIGKDALKRIKADPGIGFALGLDRSGR